MKLKKMYTYFWVIICMFATVICIQYIWHMYNQYIQTSCSKPTPVLVQEPPPCIISPIYGLYGNGRPWPPDILNNQYAQPVRDTSYNPYFNIPIGINTNIGYVNTSYRQVGILVPCNSSNQSQQSKLLVLMGRPLYVNRNKWQYYAITDQRNELKLTIRIRGKPATNEYGVDELSTNDKVIIQGYNGYYKVDLYEDNYIQYN
jgi:hypothetical protein